MAGKMSEMLTVFIAAALLLSMVAVFSPDAGEVSAQGGGLNKWVRHDLPTTLRWQMAPNTDIWDLTAADDGTLFALVEDTSGADDMIVTDDTVWDGLRWAVFPAWSDVALFKSTDGGYKWELVWHMPASESGAPIAVVPQPGYVEGDSANDAVFIATGSRRNAVTGNWIETSTLNRAGGDLYQSLDGGSSFTRVTPRCPAVTLTQRGVITSMDVAENMNAPGTFVVVVGTHGRGSSPRGEGVWTWNEDDDRDWKDKQISNAMPPAPFPGTMPAGNGLHATQVKFSPNYTEDGQIIAVVRDGSGGDPAGQPEGMYVCFYDELDGTWGGDIDSPTNVQISTTNSRMASIAVGDDYSKTGGDAWVFVGFASGGGPARDVWRIRALSTVTGPSAATATGLGVGQGGPALFINDIVVQGPAASGAVYVACDFPIAGQAQVFKGTQATLWPAWTPSFKPPSGAWPVFVTDMQGTMMAAGGSDGLTTGGVHIMVEGAGGRNVFNGRGLLDDIAVSEDIPGYVNANQPMMLGTSWCLAEAVAEEVSPMYETDGLIYVATYSEWSPTAWSTMGVPNLPVNPGSLSLWRWRPGSSWERIMYEETMLPNMWMGANAQFAGKAMLNLGNWGTSQDRWVWWPRVPRGFSEDPYVFLLGGITSGGDQVMMEMIWYSPDEGDTWINFNQMPIGAIDAGLFPPENGLVETGWWVEDNNTLFMGDANGWVYKTTDRGDSWTEGTLSATGCTVTSIITSPVYSETGNSDKCVLVGTHAFNLLGVVPSDAQHEVWLSQDGCIQDLENVGAEICTQPAWTLNLYGLPITYGPVGQTIVNFDPDWEQNHMVYSAASGWLDRWQLVGTGSKVLTRIDYADVGVYRTEINLDEPSASTWEQLWDADDFNEAVAKEPQPLQGMVPGWDVARAVRISDLQVGSEGSLYVPIAVTDLSYNIEPLVPPPGPQAENPPSPLRWGRNTLGGALRCLEPTQKLTEWEVVDRGMGEWDGLLLNRAVPGGSNTLISLTWDRQEWRWKLALYDDTLCTQSSPNDPLAGETAVGTLANNKVSVVLDWSELDASVYEWQVDNDCGFAEPYAASGVTSDQLVTVTGLDPDVKYCWRVRAVEPALSRWSDAQSFQTIIGPERIAPKLLSPVAGTTTQETRPVFQWSAIGWADSYTLQVATDGDFASSELVVNEDLGNTQGLQSPTELSDATYYWRVKASSATSETPWSATGIFTVGTPAGEGTAAWVWVLVALGVILLLLLLWLILRTRTPV